LYEIKNEQLEKWKEIVSMIEKNKKENPQDIEKLLVKLINKSETNKKNL
jgi:hypothetical protein